MTQSSPPSAMDNRTGHYTGTFVLWFCTHGIRPLYTPLSGSWVTMAESVQRILKRRSLDGQHPQTAQEIIAWLEAAARSWNPRWKRVISLPALRRSGPM